MDHEGAHYNTIKRKNMNDSTITMFKSVLLTIGFIALLQMAVHAQPTITAGDFPGFNTMVIKQRDTATALLPGPSGANVQWDFSNLVAAVSDTFYYYPSVGMPGAVNHPDANMLEVANITGSQLTGDFNHNFYKTTTGGWQVSGCEIEIHFWTLVLKWHFHYTPHPVTLPLPFTYGSESTQQYVINQSAGSYSSGVMYDSSLHVSHVTTHLVADAWGTVQTPTGSFPALRVLEQHSFVDTSFTYVAGQGLVIDSIYAPYTLTNYVWFTNGVGEVGSLSMDAKGGEGFSFFVSSTYVGVKEPINDNAVLISPNPTADKLKIETADKVEWVNIVTVDGKTILYVDNPDVIDVSGLSSGIYIARILMEDGKLVTRKFVKQ